jgi:hypothetical protein
MDNKSSTGEGLNFKTFSMLMGFNPKANTVEKLDFTK